MANEITDQPDAAAEAQEPQAPAVEAKAKSGDLSQEIIKTIDRAAGEQVTCRRVGDNHYRCNWWSMSNAGTQDSRSMPASLVTTGRISKSQFLHVTKSGRELKIRVDTL